MSGDVQPRQTLDYASASRSRWRKSAPWLIAWGVLAAIWLLICLGPPLLIDESFWMVWYPFNLPLSFFYGFLPLGKWSCIAIITTANGLLWGGLLVAIARTMWWMARSVFGNGR
jgi:hypothetical protein